MAPTVKRDFQFAINFNLKFVDFLRRLWKDRDCVSIVLVFLFFCATKKIPDDVESSRRNGHHLGRCNPPLFFLFFFFLAKLHSCVWLQLKKVKEPSSSLVKHRGSRSSIVGRRLENIARRQDFLDREEVKVDREPLKGRLESKHGGGRRHDFFVDVILFYFLSLSLFPPVVSFDCPFKNIFKYRLLLPYE